LCFCFFIGKAHRGCKNKKMTNKYIAQFMALEPHRFPYVIRHDWWNRYPIDEIDFRCDGELWLTDGTANPREMLKITCFHVRSSAQGSVCRRFEQPLQLVAKSVAHLQWIEVVYVFLDGEIDPMTAKDVLFGCKSFKATIVRNEG